MFQIQSWSHAILHLDADSFFVSVEQALHPRLKGKPVVTGGERGVATSVSIEAKRLGIKRTTPIFQIKRQFPQCIIVRSNYEMYTLFSKKMLEVIRAFTPLVEEYSIDEMFADIKGLRRPFNMSYYEIGQTIKKNIELSLGITVSIGISLTKSLAKLASSFQKPSGLTVIPGKKIEELLGKTPIQRVWGIGENTAAYLHKYNIFTALDFAKTPETFIQKSLSKPFFEIWKELRGEQMYEIDPTPKTTYFSITRSRTFYPPTNDSRLLWARLLTHIEDAFEQARELKYRAKRINLFLKTQQFKYHHTEIALLSPATYPLAIRTILKKGFQKIHKKEVLYRTTGCTISQLTQETSTQTSLFYDNITLEEKAKKLYPLYEEHKVYFGTKLYEERLKSVGQKVKIKIGLPILPI